MCLVKPLRNCKFFHFPLAFLAPCCYNMCVYLCPFLDHMFVLYSANARSSRGKRWNTLMRRGNDMIFTKCPQCGGNIAPGSVRCSHCGYSEIPSAAKNSSAALSKCPACGGEVADTASHCPHCGYTEITNSKLSRYRKYDLVQKVLTGFGLVIGVLGVIGVILSGCSCPALWRLLF